MAHSSKEELDEEFEQFMKEVSVNFLKLFFRFVIRNLFFSAFTSKTQSVYHQALSSLSRMYLSSL